MSAALTANGPDEDLLIDWLVLINSGVEMIVSASLGAPCAN